MKTNEPVAWGYKVNGTHDVFSFVEPPDDAYDEGTLTPLYTHPAKTEDEGKVCARCGAIAYDPVIAQAAKTLTDEEIIKLFDSYEFSDEGVVEFARAILRKAQEK